MRRWCSRAVCGSVSTGRDPVLSNDASWHSRLHDQDSPRFAKFYPPRARARASRWVAGQRNPHAVDVLRKPGRRAQVGGGPVRFRQIPLGFCAPVEGPDFTRLRPISPNFFGASAHGWATWRARKPRRTQAEDGDRHRSGCRQDRPLGLRCRLSWRRRAGPPMRHNFGVRNAPAAITARGVSCSVVARA